MECNICAQLGIEHEVCARNRIDKSSLKALEHLREIHGRFQRKSVGLKEGVDGGRMLISKLSPPILES